MSNIRRPAVAGMFYPAEKATLAGDVARYLAAIAEQPAGPATSPKAIIAPHAGYVYSAPVAAPAYAAWREDAGNIERVILIGPAHRVAFRGIAAPKADTFRTPLGDVAIDTAAVAAIADMPQVVLDDEPHRQEHSLEVHIPFLQQVLGDFRLVPLVAGNTSGEEVAQVLDRLWGDRRTRIVISTDLSHYHDYETARRMDTATAEAIERLDPAALGRDDACGRVPIAGLLLQAKARGLSVERLDLRTSGDTAGKKDRVVGYGSWALRETAASDRPEPRSVTVAAKPRPANPDRALLEEHGLRLYRAAAQSIGYAVKHGKPPVVQTDSFPEALRESRATFVTLTKHGQLRGCIGTLQAHQPLIADIVENAYKAALKDPRFPPLQEGETDGLEVSISLLSPFAAMSFADEPDLLRQIRPKVDGLVIADAGRRSVFLPQVWEQIPDRNEFLARLKQKAGLKADHWSGTFQAWHFTATSLKAERPPQP